MLEKLIQDSSDMGIKITIESYPGSFGIYALRIDNQNTREKRTCFLLGIENVAIRLQSYLKLNSINHPTSHKR